ncbi:MAG TPA: hypothetical protein VJK52_00785, partial [Candidatus Nanoarchaeia archaeon]|nr:hypothetical protein [Candidatus Nanoarchaeia archaeon]
LLLLAFSIGAYTLLFRNRASRTLWALFGSSYLLLGHFVPFAVVLRVLPLPWIGQTMNLAIFRADEIYKTIGLPFLGFLLLFAFFVLLMMHPRKSNISNA